MKPIDARRLSQERREHILKRDGNLCFYCFDEADEVDHLVPWSYRQDDSLENLVAACWLCNRIASNKMFESIEAKKNHIIRRRERFFRRNVLSIWTETEVSDLGPGLRRDVKTNCIVVESDVVRTEAASKLMARGWVVNARPVM